MNLVYLTAWDIEELPLGHATIRGSRKLGGTIAWWMLWMCVKTTEAAEDYVAVPVDAQRSYHEDGPHGRTWGLAKEAEGVWNVVPSIDVEATGAADAASVWHENVRLVGVPPEEPWMGGPPA